MKTYTVTKYALLKDIPNIESLNATELFQFIRHNVKHWFRDFDSRFLTPELIDGTPCQIKKANNETVLFSVWFDNLSGKWVCQILKEQPSFEEIIEHIEEEYEKSDVCLAELLAQLPAQGSFDDAFRVFAFLMWTHEGDMTVRYNKDEDWAEDIASGTKMTLQELKEKISK